MKRTKFIKTVAIVAVCFVFLLTLAINHLAGTESTHTLGYNTLLKMIQDDMLDSIQFQEGTEPYKVIIWPKEDAKFYYKNLPYDEYEVEIVDKTHLLKNLENNSDIKITVEDKTSSDFSFGDIFYCLFLIFYMGVIFYTLAPQSIKEKIHSLFGKNLFEENGSEYLDRTPRVCVTFDNVAGLVEEKQELQEIINFLEYPEKYRKMGAEIPKGVLLSGEPGTGKTLLAKAVAGEAGVEYLAVSGSEFVEKYVGTGASRIRKLFKEAKKIAPCIIFIDEIDAIGSKRTDSTNSGGESEYNQTLEQLLTELDGFSSSDEIIILAATNRPQSLDPALTRPGRFDRKITFSLPDIVEREAILKLYSHNKRFMDDVDLKRVAYNSAGFSGAELKSLLNEAAIAAVKFEHTAIYMSDIEYARKKIILGLEKSKKIISEKEKLITAYHESGHAIVSKFFKSQDSVTEICIIPRGTAGGYTINNVIEEKMYCTKTEFYERIVVLLAGMAAEKIALGDISTGPSNDIEIATEIVKHMITRYGMDDDIGPVSIANCDSIQKELGVGSKISVLLKDAENVATDILQVNREFLEETKKILLEKECISGEEFDKIFQKYSKRLKKWEANS